MKYIFMFMMIFVISCGGETKKEDNFNCNECKENEVCNEVEKKC